MAAPAAALHALRNSSLPPSSSLASSSLLAQRPISLCLPLALPYHVAKRPLKFKVSAHTGRNENGRRARARARAGAGSRIFALLASAAAVSNSSPAQAVTVEEVAAALTKVQNAYQQVTGVTGTAYGMVRMLLEQIFTSVKVAVGATTPYVQQATDVAVQVAAPLVSGVVTRAEKSLQIVGIDARPVAEAVKTVAVIVGEATKQIIKALEPIASSILQLVLATDSLLLFRGAGAVVLVYLLAPPIFSSVACAARGYKGDLSALQALDSLTKEDHIIIDVRTEKEKSKSGVPSLPRYATNKLLCVPVEELSLKFKGQLRDYRKVEAEVAAVKISYLKRIRKTSKLVILDRYGDIAKIVARSLTRLGFKNTWVVIDGFDGGKGWVQNRLGTESHNTSIADLFLPSRIISAGTKKIFPSSKDIDVSPQFNKLLPGGYDES